MKIELNFLEQSIYVECSKTNKEILEKAAEEVRNVLSSISRSSQNASDQKKMILAALNITAKMLEQEKRLDLQESQLKRLEQTIDSLLAEAENGGLQEYG